MRPYQTVFSRQASQFVAGANEDIFAEIARWVDRIERMPFTSGDYTEQDDDNRELQVIVLREVAIVYWPDHAVREVRVVRIEMNLE